jgi:hypothetical protein
MVGVRYLPRLEAQVSSEGRPSIFANDLQLPNRSMTRPASTTLFLPW